MSKIILKNITFTEEILNGKLHFLCNDGEYPVSTLRCFNVVCLRDKSTNQESKGVPLLITFHSKFRSIGQLLSKHMHIIYIDQETRNIFTPGLVAKFCSARKLSSNLLRTKLNPIERIVGSFT